MTIRVVGTKWAVNYMIWPFNSMYLYNFLV